jgi:O-antigen/teichoic acid export membrane protein
MLFSAAFALNAILNFIVGLLMARFLGPEAFGVYALAFSLALLIGGFGLEWLKHAAIRFYAPDAAGAERLLLRLHASLAVSAVIVGAAGLLLALASPWRPSAPASLLISVASGVAFGGYEYVQALARQRGDARGYFVAVGLRNLATFGAVGAVASGAGALEAMGAMGFAAALGMAYGLWRLPRPSRRAAIADAPSVKAMAAHAFPLVWAGGLYAALSFLARSSLAFGFGAEEAGQFAFASDVGFKVLCTTSAIVELMLLPRVMRTLQTQGRAAAMVDASQALVVGLALIAPLCVGYLVTLPAFELLIAPPRYRGHFSDYTLAMTPAFLALALAQACFTTILIVDKRSAVVTAGASAALAAGVIGLALAPSAITTALATGLGYSVGLGVIAFKALRAPGVRPNMRDLGAIGLGLALMVAAIWPLRGLSPAWIGLPAMAALGALVYGTTLYFADVAGFRRGLSERLGRRGRASARASATG